MPKFRVETPEALAAELARNPVSRFRTEMVRHARRRKKQFAHEEEAVIEVMNDFKAQTHIARHRALKDKRIEHIHRNKEKLQCGK